MKSNTPPLKVEFWPIARLKPCRSNSRAHPPSQVDGIVKSIQAFGWTKPILVDDKGEILAGHGARLAALQLEMPTVPVIQRLGLTQAQKRAYRIADNRIAESSAWDTGILGAELGALKDAGFDLTMTGFTGKEIDLILRPPQAAPDTEPPKDPGAKGPTVTKAGDLWQLGEHRILCADNGKLASWKALMKGKRASLVFTDPPYGVTYDDGTGKFAVLEGDALRRGKLQKMLGDAFGNAMDATHEKAPWYVWHAHSSREDFSQALRDCGMVELGYIIWVKPGFTMGWADYKWAHEPCFYVARQGVRPAFYGDRTQSTVWRVAAVRKDDQHQVTTIGSGVTLTSKAGEIHVAASAPKGRKVRHVTADIAYLAAESQADDVWEVSRDSGKEGAAHPTQKPVELARRAILNSSAEGELVLDFFSGAGSTLLAAEQTGRIGMAMELEPQYVDATVRRWQALTGKDAVHAETKKTWANTAKARRKAD